MKKNIVLIIICVLPQLLLGQYTYFNKQIPPPFPEFGSGSAFNLFVTDSSIITFGAYGDGPNSLGQTNFILDYDGNLINQLNFDLPFDQWWALEYSESCIEVEDGYLFGLIAADNNYPFGHGRVKKYNLDFTLSWEYLQLNFQDEDVVGSEYNLAREISDGFIVAAGVVIYDTIPEETGDTHATFIITKLQSDGAEVWHKNYDFTADEYFPLQQYAVRPSDLFELANGDLLVFGGWYYDWQPMALKFDSEGNFLDHVKWGNPLSNDWLPWPVQINDSLFMFAYQHAIGSQPDWDDWAWHKPRVGILNSNTMTVEFLNTYDHEHYFGFITDFEKTTDGGYAILGWGGDDQSFEESYILKIDAEGNEEWYQSYDPPIAHITSEALDLEVTADGGFAFVGNFELANKAYYSSWVVKTDACGDEVFNGCPTAIAEWKIENGELKMWPNPTNNTVNIASDEEMQGITIRDIAGKIVCLLSLKNHVLKMQVDISMLAKGLYLVEVDFGQGRSSAQRLVME